MAEKLYAIESTLKRSKFIMGGQMKLVYEINIITKSGVRDTLDFDPDVYLNHQDKVLAELQRIAEIHEGYYK